MSGSARRCADIALLGQRADLCPIWRARFRTRPYALSMDAATYWSDRTSPMTDAHVIHQRAAIDEFSALLAVIDKAMFVLAFSLEHQTPVPWNVTFANDFGARACLSRAFS